MSNSTISDQSLMDKSMRSVFGEKNYLIIDFSSSIMIPHNLEICLLFLTVGNIPYEATEENLKDIFSEVGPVLSFK